MKTIKTKEGFIAIAVGFFNGTIGTLGFDEELPFVIHLDPITALDVALELERDALTHLESLYEEAKRIAIDE